MSSIWKINGADIYVDGDEEINEPVIAELQPIAGSESVFHYIMTPNRTHNLAGTVIGSGYLETIMNGSGSNVSLVTDLIPGGVTVLLMNVQSSRQNVYAQRVDPLQDETAPVYKVTCTVRT